MRNEFESKHSTGTNSAALGISMWLCALAVVGTLASDAAASLIYVANAGSDNIRKYDTATNADVGLLANVSSPNGMVLHGGNVYVTSRNTGTIVKVTPEGVTSTFATTGGQPMGIAVDASGNFFVSNITTNHIQKVTPAGAVSTWSLESINGSYALAFDSTGALYASSDTAASIFKYNTSAVRTTFAAGLSGVAGLAIDGSNNVYAARQGNNNITKFTPGGSASNYASASALNNIAFGLAFDTDGTLLVTGYNNPGRIVEIDTLGVGTLMTTSNLNYATAIVVVPEPASLGLVVLGAGLLRRRRGR